ncbi:MAG: tail fiber domain-containing protein [Hyphomicrobiales bacterium]|nr:tail fiber domain-containing protein [Hyphomicrobiales bacterium]
MGGTSKSETTNLSSSTQPWAPAQPLLNGILGQLGGALGRTGLTGTENAALDRLAADAQAGNPYASAIGGVASGLLAGGPDRSGIANDAYQRYRSDLESTARGDLVDPSKNPALQGYLSTIANDVQSRVNGMFAGAGRDLSGANQMALARGLAEGQSPVLLDAYTRARADQLAAQDKLYGAGGQTAGLLSQLDQQRLANQQAGIGAANAALQAASYAPQQQLAIEAQRRGIPLQNLQQLAGIGVPIAGLGNQSIGTKTTETSTPFNPLSLAPLALAPFTGGASLAGMGASALGSGLFSGYGGLFGGAGSGPRVGPFSW